MPNQQPITVTRLTALEIEWTDEHGNEHRAWVEMVLAHDDEYPSAVVDAVTAYENRRVPKARNEDV